MMSRANRKKLAFRMGAVISRAFPELSITNIDFVRRVDDKTSIFQASLSLRGNSTRDQVLAELRSMTTRQTVQVANTEYQIGDPDDDTAFGLDTVHGGLTIRITARDRTTLTRGHTVN